MAYRQPQESLVSSTQDRTSSWLKAVDESRSVSDASDRDSLINSHGSEKSGLTVDDNEQSHSFPWLSSFGHKCADLIDRKLDLPILHNLMSEFVLSLTADVNECYKKPNRAAKLKKVVNEYLLFFHMIYLDIKEPLENLPYLNRMSDLLAMYVDLEIKASRRRKEHAKIICGKLTTALFVFLRYSMDHILDTMLKTRLMAKTSMEISAPVLGRVLRDKPLQPICELTYVRYILVYKLWKKVVRGAEARRRINKQASSLVLPPDEFRRLARGTIFDGILPSIPKSRTDITQFFMQAKFSVKEKAKTFLKISQDVDRGGVALLPNFTPEMDKSLFYEEFLESSCRFGDSPIREERGISLLDEVYNTMSDSASTTDLISDAILGRSIDNSTQEYGSKKKAEDIITKKLTKKKSKNKELKEDLCDSTKKNKNKLIKKLGKPPSSLLNKIKNKKEKIKKEVPVEMLSRLKISKDISNVRIRKSISPVIDDNVDVIKKFSPNQVIDGHINGGSDITDTSGKNDLSSVITETTEDDDDEEDDDDDDDDDADDEDDKSSVSGMTFKEESESQEEKEAERTEDVDLSFTNKITPEKDKEQNKDGTVLQLDSNTNNNNSSSNINNEGDNDNNNDVNHVNDVNHANDDNNDDDDDDDVIVVEESQQSDNVQCRAVSSDDNNMVIDKSEDTNDNEASFRGFPLSLPLTKDLPTAESVSDHEEPKVDIPPSTVQESIGTQEPTTVQASSFTMNEDSNSSDCIFEGVIPAANFGRSQRSRMDNTSTIKSEEDNLELAGILEGDALSVYPVPTIEEQSEISGEEFLSGLMQQWSSQVEIYTYNPSYELDVVEPCTNIISVSNGEEDIISGNGDAFFGSICNSVMASDDREGDSTSTRSSYESPSNVRDGKITSRGKTQPTMDCSTPERSSSDVNVQTCMSDSEPQTPASENENSPEASLNTVDVRLTSPCRVSSPAATKSVETSTFSPFVSLSRTDINEHQSNSRLNSPEPVSNTGNKKAVKRKAVSFRDAEQPPSKQLLHEEEPVASVISATISSENRSSNSTSTCNVRERGGSNNSSKKDKDSLVKSIETSVNRNDSNNNSDNIVGTSSGSNSSSSCREVRDSKDSRSSSTSTSSTSTSRGKSSARRTRKSSDLLDHRPLAELARDREKEIQRERELLERMEKESLEEKKKKERSRNSKQTRHETYSSSSTSKLHHGSSHSGSSTSNNSRSHKQNHSQQRKKKGSGGHRLSWEETAYNPPKTRQTTLKEKEDAAQLELQPSSDQPRRSPKKNML